MRAALFPYRRQIIRRDSKKQIKIQMFGTNSRQLTCFQMARSVSGSVWGSGASGSSEA